MITIDQITTGSRIMPEQCYTTEVFARFGDKAQVLWIDEFDHELLSKIPELKIEVAEKLLKRLNKS